MHSFIYYSLLMVIIGQGSRRWWGTIDRWDFLHISRVWSSPHWRMGYGYRPFREYVPSPSLSFHIFIYIIIVIIFYHSLLLFANDCDSVVVRQGQHQGSYFVPSHEATRPTQPTPRHQCPRHRPHRQASPTSVNLSLLIKKIVYNISIMYFIYYNYKSKISECVV